MKLFMRGLMVKRGEVLKYGASVGLFLFNAYFQKRDNRLITYEKIGNQFCRF